VDFADTYKKLPTHKLLEILQNKSDYRPEAIEAAELELKSRTDVDAAHEALKEKTAKEEERKHKQNDIRQKVVEVISPADAEKEPRRTVNIICFFLLLYTLYRLYYAFEFMGFLLENQNMLNVYVLFYLAEFVLLPVSLYFFYKRTKHGWYLMLIWLIYHVAAGLFGFVTWLVYYNRDELDYSTMDSAMFSIVVPLILYGVTIFLISRANTRILFINERALPETLDEDSL
jgi:hypothetical protein